MSFLILSNFLYKITIAVVLSEKTLETEALGCTEHHSIAVHRDMASRTGYQPLDMKCLTPGYWAFKTQ